VEQAHFRRAARRVPPLPVLSGAEDSGGRRSYSAWRQADLPGTAARAFAAGAIVACLCATGWAQTGIPKIPGIEEAATPREVATTLQTLGILTVLTLAPAILIMTTSFTRIVVVLSLLRQALATQQLPPNQVLVGLALFMTFVVMAPTWKTVNDEALTPYLSGEITDPHAAYERGIKPVREFMFRQTRPEDVRLFLKFSKTELSEDATYADVPTVVVMPAFMISELKTAFEMGFRLFLPFLIVDMVISSILISMGMLMLPPVLISLPFKLLLFVLADGWYLVVGSLMSSFK
jgi:flagellar biosynthetic protein FliP